MTRLAVSLLVLCGVLTGTAAAAVTAEAVREAVQAVLANEDFQRELPQKKPKEEEKPEDDDDEWGDFSGRLTFGDLGPVGKTLLWVLAIAGGVLIVFYLFSDVSRRFGRAEKKEPDQPDPSWRVDGPERPTDPGSLELADQLARQGDFAAAIHLLLMRSFEDLRRHIDGAIAASLTSREIVSRVPLDEGRRGALSTMVAAAELCHFGGRPPTDADYERCRESFIRFAPAPPAEEATA